MVDIPNVCIEVNVYSYIGIKTGAHCSMFYLETEHLHLSAILSTVLFSSLYTELYRIE